MNASDLLSIGELARRTGLSVSAIRFYEDKGLIAPLRTKGNQRRFLRSDIRRLSFILIVQRLGLSLEEIGEHLRALPQGRAPSSCCLTSFLGHLTWLCQPRVRGWRMYWRCPSGRSRKRAALHSRRWTTLARLL